MDEGRRRACWIFSLAVLLGTLAGAVADLGLFVSDDSCPQWASEGTMAAPGSPFSHVMCGPGEPPSGRSRSASWSPRCSPSCSYVEHRSPGWQLGWRGRRSLMLVPALIVGLLHVTLPEDCLSGRTESGDCGRDRELR